MVGVGQLPGNFLRLLHDQGILDHNFENVRRTQAQGNHLVLSEVLTMFIYHIDVSMTETTRLMTEPELDYETLADYLQMLQGKSASIGGCLMAAACREVRQAIDARDKARCLETFELVKQEYLTLKNILLLERCAMAYENWRDGAGGAA
ncbi:histidine-containing phosphotransfer protein 1-like [Mangifera indica]|uniref:histidine-containing phosphotransfer protein 1-like n=1 Tax=Mangifera indica TaxID=29780 RepID=UPI001CF9F5E5|nr:histidine-containing phosphotransfer protein 1-like [Mangifera indica]